MTLEEAQRDLATALRRLSAIEAKCQENGIGKGGASGVPAARRGQSGGYGSGEGFGGGEGV